MRSITLAIVFFLVTCWTAPVLAQSANISGKVIDSQGASVKGATIILFNTETQVEQTTLSGENGNFILPPAAPGRYELRGEATGFESSVVSGIILEVGQPKVVNLRLSIGSVSQSVVVTDSPPELNVENSDRSTVLESTLVNNIPLDVRNPLQLINMTPGVMNSDAGTAGTNFSSQSTTNTFRINGANGGESDIMIDGATDTIFYDTHAVGAIPGLDAVQEFRVYTIAYSPEYGHTSGGIVSYALHSGTEQLHGSVWEFFRNDAMDANGYNANKAHQTKPPFSRNQFGFALGGPIYIPKIYDGRHKTFFFGTYEGLRDNYVTAGGFTATVPTALERKGDFSKTINADGSSLVVYDPSSTTLQPAGSTVCSAAVQQNQTVYCRNQISYNGVKNVMDPNRINSVGQALLNLYPLPNQLGLQGSDQNNYFSDAASRDVDNSFDARIDHHFSDKHSIFMHADDFQNFIYYPDVYGNQQSPNNADNHIPGYNVEVGHSWVISPYLIFEHHISWAHMESARTSAKPLGTAMFGFPASAAPGLTATFTPQVQAITGQLSEIANSEPFERNPNSVWQYASSMTWLKGNHTLKFGTDLRRYPGQLWDPQLMTVNTSKSFTAGPNPASPKGTTGNGIAELLLGQATVTSGYAPKVNFAHQYYAVYAEDIAKITPKLVLTFGLRYSYEAADVAVNDALSFLDTSSPSPIASQVSSIPNLVGGVGIPGQNGLSTSLQVPGKLHFDPRLGVAYNIDSKTVFHGGFGIFYHPTASWGTNPAAYGFTRKSTSIDAQPDGVTPLYNLADPFPNGLPTPYGNAAGLGIELGQAISGNLRKQSTSYQENWSIDLQRSLPQHFVLTMTYAGSTGVHLLGAFQLNQLSDANLSSGSAINKVVPNPFYGVITDSSSVLSTSTVQSGYLLRDHPQFMNFESLNVGWGHSNYEAGQLTLEHRLGQGLSLLFGYTYSKSIDDVGQNGTSATVQDNGCHRCERSVSDMNQTNVVRMSAIYELPFGHNKPFLTRGIVSVLAGGWQLGTIYQYDTGEPIALTSPIQQSSLNGGANSTTANQMRPTLVPGVNMKTPTISKTGQKAFFNTAAFTETGTYAFGNAPRNLPGINQPSYFDFDALLQKSTRINERMNAVFRIEMLNATNNVILAGPLVDVSNASTFGYSPLTQTNNPREIQISGRFNF